jgi:adenine-specific DNA-methyltransferase
MPTLEWIGKSKVINHHQEVPFRVLERQYSYDESGQHDEDNGSENMIIRGDNLEALKALLPRYEGRVKCIYIDIILQNLIQSRGIIEKCAFAV